MLRTGRTVSDDDLGLGLGRRALAEGVGTALLVATVVGSGVMAERLSPNDVGLQLLQNAIATGAVLVALISTFIGVSGAHFNPVVTLADRLLGERTTRESLAYVGAQVAGGVVGCLLANAMFEAGAGWSTKDRSGSHLWLAEVVATFGLLLVIHGTAKRGDLRAIPAAVGGYITAAYYFTSSTSFANPAVTIGRMASDTFAGIDPRSVPAFLAAQAIGLVVATGFTSLVLVPERQRPAGRVRG